MRARPAACGGAAAILGARRVTAPDACWLASALQAHQLQHQDHATAASLPPAHTNITLLPGMFA